MAKDFKVRRYGFDRERKKKQNLKKALLTLVAVAVAGAAGWLLYEPVYDFVTNFQMPSLGQPDSSSQSEDPAQVPPASSSSSQPSGEEAEPRGLPDSTAYVPTYLLSDTANLETYLSGLKAQGVEGAVIELKSPEGKVLYQSGLEIVAANLAQGESPYDLEAAAAAIRQAGLIPVGRLWTFRDSISTATMYEAAVKYMGSNINWIDNSKAAGGKPWLNPNSVQAQDYMLELIGEAADMGLHAVILEGMQFPEGYSLELATYGNAGTLDKSQVLADFAARARQAGESKSCQVWPAVSLTATAKVYEIPYGDAPEKIIQAAGRAVINVQPEQFGTGIATEALALSNPALDPYGTVKAGLEASQEALEAADEAELAAMVQAYTSTTLPEGSNKAYGAAEISDQTRALHEAGVEKVFYYSPSGTYTLSQG